MSETKNNRAYEIRKMSGLTQAAFAEKYNIPKRTIEAWEASSENARRDAPNYVLDLLEKEVKLDCANTKRTTTQWIDNADEIDLKFQRHDYVCSKCEKKAYYFIGGTEDWWCMEKPNYCPNCGAKMI